MLLVILGAGASFDSVPSNPTLPATYSPLRPPLADQLFDNRPIYHEAMQRFRDLHSISGELAHRHGLSLERKLQSLAAEAADYPERYKQLMSVRYYIQYILWRGEEEWVRDIGANATNYRALLDQIDRWRKHDEPVCLVSFNYDRLIEHALNEARVPTNQLSDYIASTRFKLFKVHGSIHWVRTVRSEHLEPTELGHHWPSTFAVIANAATLEFSKQFEIAGDYPTGFRNGDFVAPAIAVPLEDKTEFELPEEHLRLLKSLIPQTDRMLIIGWRATEQHFLRMLRDGLKSRVSGYVVCKDTTEGEETASRLGAAGIDGDYTISEGGFTNMITRRELDGFLGHVK